MQNHVNLVDLVKSFPTNILLQNLASIQKRTSPIKFAHLSEESENGSISNLSTKVATSSASLAHFMARNSRSVRGLGPIGIDLCITFTLSRSNLVFSYERRGQAVSTVSKFSTSFNFLPVEYHFTIRLIATRPCVKRSFVRRLPTKS